MTLLSRVEALTGPDRAELIEALAKQLARMAMYGPDEGAEHLDVHGYRAKQDEITWPDRDEDKLMFPEDMEDYVSPGRDTFRRQAKDVLLALEVAGFAVLRAKEGT